MTVDGFVDKRHLASLAGIGLRKLDYLLAEPDCPVRRIKIGSLTRFDRRRVTEFLRWLSSRSA